MANKSKSTVRDATNLTSAEKQIIKGTWQSNVKKDLKYHGCQIFVKLFTKYPEYMALFHFSQTGAPTELMENKDFQAHGLVVMIAVNSFIEYGFEDPALFKALLAKVGKNHFRRKITSIPIEHFCEIMLEHVMSTFKKRPKSEVEETWRRFMLTIFDGFLEQLSI